MQALHATAPACLPMLIKSHSLESLSYYRITNRSRLLMMIDQIKKNNEEWVGSKPKGYFEPHCKGQAPKVLYIGCSDSRVVPEAFMGLDLGEVFVHRNVANMVPNNDMSSTAVIQYAVGVLKVEHIVVCGHTKCGGAGAALGTNNLGLINPWVRNIKDTYRLHEAELDAIADPAAREARFIELNAIEQCINVMKVELVQQVFKEANRNLELHAWVYDVCSGKIKDLGLTAQQAYDTLPASYHFH